MAEIDPSVALSIAIPEPAHSGIAAADTGADTKWVQHALNSLGHHPPLDEDDSYGGKTLQAVEQFQRSYGLDVDGLAGDKTIAGLRAALAAMEAEKGAAT